MRSWPYYYYLVSYQLLGPGPSFGGDVPLSFRPPAASGLTRGAVDRAAAAGVIQPRFAESARDEGAEWRDDYHFGLGQTAR